MRRLLALTVLTTTAYAEPRRELRPTAAGGGLAVIGAGGGEALPFLVAHGALDLDARFSAVVDAAFFTSGDRVFGPRGLVRAGVRAYLQDATWNPYLAASVVGYHELDVDYEYSDASQQSSSSLGAGATLGNELVTSGGLSWVIEAGAFQLFGLSDRAVDGLSWQVDTMVGFRF